MIFYPSAGRADYFLASFFAVELSRAVLPLHDALFFEARYAVSGY